MAMRRVEFIMPPQALPAMRQSSRPEGEIATYFAPVRSCPELYVPEIRKSGPNCPALIISSSNTSVIPVNLLATGPTGTDIHLILAHGAGAPMTSPFMDAAAALLAERDICVTRFEFAYMAARREGARKPPPKAERLVEEYRACVETVSQKLMPSQHLFIGGKSMGGRVASLIAGALYGERVISGCICLGYPFHPPKKPDELRTAHLIDTVCPTLIVQGERDPFGPRGEVESYTLSRAIDFHWATDGDHDLSPRKSSGATHVGNLEAAADAIADFCKKRAHVR
jgi:uncharacterized protein